MRIITTVDEMRQVVKRWRREGNSIGFVPTMGYLHAGHESLVKKAVAENDCVAVSIFVNPTQFGPGEDLDKYPRDMERDSLICQEAGAKVIFFPSVEEMYPQGCTTYVDMDGLTDHLCGKSRPTHFRGVCTVVSKLFNIVTPDRAYFGQKDAQQLLVIRRMAADLNMDIEIIGCPIIREEDGLAMSSRNTYLSTAERAAALSLSRGLKKGLTLLKNGEKDADAVKTMIRQEIENEPLACIDYIELVDLNSLESVETIKESVLAAVAVFFGKTRLIDNFIFEMEN